MQRGSQEHTGTGTAMKHLFACNAFSLFFFFTRQFNICHAYVVLFWWKWARLVSQVMQFSFAFLLISPSRVGFCRMFLPPWWTWNGSTRSLSLPQHSSARGCSLPWCGGSWPLLMVIWSHEILVSLDLFPVSLPSTPSLQRSSSPSRCRWETGWIKKIYDR